MQENAQRARVEQAHAWASLEAAEKDPFRISTDDRRDIPESGRRPAVHPGGTQQRENPPRYPNDGARTRRQTASQRQASVHYRHSESPVTVSSARTSESRRRHSESPVTVSSARTSESRRHAAQLVRRPFCINSRLPEAPSPSAPLPTPPARDAG